MVFLAFPPPKKKGRKDRATMKRPLILSASTSAEAVKGNVVRLLGKKKVADCQQLASYRSVLARKSAVHLGGRQRRGFCGKKFGNSAENLGIFAKIRLSFYCARNGCGNSVESLQQYRGKFQTNFCNDPLPNDSIK